MKFDPDPAAGFGDTVANLAREMGHAFGLVHEHQRPDAGKGVPRSSFACENLGEHQSYKDRHYDMKDLCSNLNLAANAGFSAMDSSSQEFIMYQ